MTRAVTKALLLAAAALAASAACTMKETDTPPLTGPSEFGTSVTVSIDPDQLTLDGLSQAKVTITAFDAHGAPLPDLRLR